jgi:hypothetical protein
MHNTAKTGEPNSAENIQATVERPFRANLFSALGVTPLPGFGQGDREQDARLCGIYAAASNETRRALDEAFKTATRGKSLRDLLSTIGTFRE